MIDGSRVIVSLDYADETQALELVNQLDQKQCRLKIGKELFTRTGPGLIDKLNSKGFDVFLDLKFHDIPNTVARACEAAADLGIWMMNVHASGGRRMLEKACASLAGKNHRPILVAVTVLTSMEENDLAEIGINSTMTDQVMRLARLAQDSGLEGVVCSAQEAPMIRQHLGDEFKLVTPGIRPAGVQSDDQKRTMTPAEAIKAGSHYLVIGRPVTRSNDPARVLETINCEIDSIT